MKKISSAIAILFLILGAFGQNGLKGGDYFLLLNDRKSISLNGFENNTIKQIRTFPVKKESIYTTDHKTRVAIVDTANNNIRLYDLKTSQETKLSIPFDIRPETVLLNDDNLFIGGEMGKEMLVQYHIKSGQWYQLEIPEEIRFPGKAIDDLVVNDSLLLAIDNIIMPKYVLFYRLHPANKPVFSHFKKLKSNGAYEHIYQGRLSGNYFGLISETSSGYVGTTGHITIYQNIDLKESFSVSSNQQDKDYHTFNDFVIIEDKVVIASKEKGLGVFDIEQSYFKASDGSGNRLFNADVGTSKIRYTAYKNEMIRKLTLLPNTKKIILTLENKRGLIRHTVIEI